jgi:hypothetical protein
MKRYFAIVWPKRRAAEAMLLAGCERDGKILSHGKSIGFALDYYEDEIAECLREYKSAIIGDYATRQEAEAAVDAMFATPGEEDHD